jgi:hypothetical protein
MTDYSDLKRMAECATGFTDMSLAPDVVLGLIAENESLKHSVAAGAAREWDLRSQVRNAKESRARVVLSNKALRKDAERYRWLRENHIFAHVQVEQSDGTLPYVYDSELDRSIDEIMAAMSKDG